ncbi:hypothetical protein [Rhodococcus sp. PvR099]|uniref:hypothetical protein n=1 Tax=Rhodococcus sp. PvR099 TaxID=2806602 RepID=UPI001AE53908|nr:hypothetical protein [Rhodococcus sp. PvR099]MBP1158617.1 hypothetical protein [Rhodococcus sp. PvR099]
MTLLAERLTQLSETRIDVVTFDALGLDPEQVQDEIVDVAAGPLAPLIAEAVVHAVNTGDSTWRRVVELFPRSFTQQRSLLALSSSIETILGSSAATESLGKMLNAALLDGLQETISSGPLLAAARLEGAVRLAVSKAVHPYHVWGVLQELKVDGPDDFLERLPRILGLALDCWAQTDTTVATAVRNLLKQLATDEAADVDAMFELGCDRLRASFAAATLAESSTHLNEARQLFAAAEAAEECRDDAAAYHAACDAILAFAAGNYAQVSEAAEKLETVLERRAAWLWGTHQQAWLLPRRSVELAWNGLLLQLQAASSILTADVWMTPWSALDAVLAAYRSSRTVQPLGADIATPGLAALIEPAVEDTLIRRESFLNILRHAAGNPETHPQRLFDADTAATILSRIESRQTNSQRNESTVISDEGDPGGASVDDRLYRLAPNLIRQAGLDFARRLAADIDDTRLATIEGLAHDSDIARLRATDPIIVPLLDSLVTSLCGHPDFIGEVRHTFSALVVQTLLFLKSRGDLTRTTLFGKGKKGDPPYDYRRKPENGQRQALEDDLQRDFHGWLQAGPLHNVVRVEPVDLAMGRADVMIHFGSLRYLIEIKKDSTDNSREHIEGTYLAQAAEYSNTNAPFGQLLVLDLTDKKASTGTLRLNEATWIAKHRPTGAREDRYVLTGILAGNRITPSTYSK